MKLKIGFAVIGLLLISVISAYAQAGPITPCQADDNDGTCPLDTWVIVLVIFVSIFAAFRLYRRKKSSIQVIR
jgi:hypothetical protein